MMFRTGRRGLTATLATLALLSAPLAQAAEGDRYFGIGGHYTLVDSKRPNLSSGGPGWSLLYGYTLPAGLTNTTLDLEFAGFGNYIGRDVDLMQNPFAGRGDDYHYGLGADLRLRSKAEQAVQPYVLFGIGLVYEDRDRAEDWFAYANLGAGLRIATPFQNLAVRTEARYYAINNDQDVANRSMVYDGRLGLGLELSLNRGPVLKDSDGDGVIDSVDRCPGTPRGTVVDGYGCPLPVDSDGDGVPDTIDRCPGTPAGTPVDEYGCALPPPPAPPAPLPSRDSDGDGVPDNLDACPNTPPGLKVDAQGCVIQQSVVFPDVTFESASDRLTAQARNALRLLERGLSSQPGLRFEIGGHTDSTGPLALNMGLSERRARAVRDHLVSLGVDSARLTVRGYGPTRPIASNATVEGRAQNRRVEFSAITP